jgi:hypothetical protein
MMLRRIAVASCMKPKVLRQTMAKDKYNDVLLRDGTALDTDRDY